MSRQIDENEPLSDEDRDYLAQRGDYARIRRIDERHGTSAEPEAETEESLGEQIAELEGQAEALRARQTALRLAREQEESRVRDTTVVDGKGGEVDRSDDYEDAKWTKATLAAEIEKRNEQRDDEDKISSNGTKAQLIERLRAMDAEELDEDEDDSDEDDEDDE